MSCHRPFDDLCYFELNPDRCNSCQKKLEKAKMKRTEKREEEKRKRSPSPPVSDSDGEFLHSEVEEEKVADDEEAQFLSSRSKKRRRICSSDEDGCEDDDDLDSARKKNRKKKKKETPDETLLKYLDEGTRKQVSFDANKKKKRKYNRKQNSVDEGEDAGSAFEDLIRSLANYKRSCPSRTSIQIFLMSK